MNMLEGVCWQGSCVSTIWPNRWMTSKECRRWILPNQANDAVVAVYRVYCCFIICFVMIFLVASISADSLPGCHACVIILCFYCIWRINEWMNKSDRRNISIEVNKSPRRSIKCRSICPTLSILHSELLCPLLFPIVSTDAAIFKHVFYDYALGIIVIFAALWLWRY